MRSFRYLLFALSLLFSAYYQAQALRENNKWGFKSGDQWIIPARYDTIFGFDSTNKVCMACNKSKSSSNSKFIKVTSTSYACHYYNNAGKKLVLRNQFNDTFSVCSFNKASLRSYQGNSRFFVANVKNKKYLFTKDFKQLTFNEYHDIRTTSDPEFYIAQVINDMDQPVTGLVNKMEHQVIPFQYSDISFNAKDSLIIACSAGVNASAGDDVYNYEGKKIASSQKHIDMATKNFLVHKIFEPKEHFLIYDLANKTEKQLQADEVGYYNDNEIVIRLKNDWFIYDMRTHTKRPKN